MNLFHKLRYVNWSRFTIVVGATAIFWAGIGTILPQKLHTLGLVLLTSLQSALTFLMRGTRYVEREGQPPPPGVHP